MLLNEWQYFNMQKIQTICVIGSGVMGSGIAAQIANSKTSVILLDIADNKYNIIRIYVFFTAIFHGSA